MPNPLVRIRYNPDRKRYFLIRGDQIVGTKNGYPNRDAAEKARLQQTLVSR